jgi:hypothetical protein
VPSGGTKAPAMYGPESYVDSLLGIDDGVSADTSGSAGADEPWMAEGEPVPIPGPYQERHRDTFLWFLKETTKHNRKAVAGFLKEFVDASVSIVARYGVESVRENKDALLGFITFALTEGIGFLAGGMASVAGKKALTILMSKGVEYFAGRMLDSSDSLKKEKDMFALIDDLAGASGEYVEAMVLQLGGNEIDAAYWLKDAPLDQLGKFRVPARFHAPHRDDIRGAFAGAVAGRHHRITVGGQMGSGPQLEETNTVTPDRDNHVILVDVSMSGAETTIENARFKSSSDVLADEIVGKVHISQLETVALHVNVTGEKYEDAVKRLVAALRQPYLPEEGDEAAFAAAYPKVDKPLTFWRMPDGAMGAKGGGLGDELVLYQWSTGDHDLSRMAQDINSTEENDEAQASQPSYFTMKYLAEQARYRISVARLHGAHMIATSAQLTKKVPKRG